MRPTKIKKARSSRPTDKTDIIFKTQVGRKLDMAKNSLKKIRESLLMSKSELAREANVSPITITRIEEGKPCRMETKRKILLALGYSLSDAKKIFNE
jgi:DNA-binding XRE family transcriptional regulator